MPRPLRQELAGGLFHVYARGNDKRRIYLDDRDRRLYLELLAKTIAWRRWNCLSYCLMDNHVHLVLETPQPNLGAGMQQLHGRYARQFNDRYGRTGHLFEHRYGAIPVRSDRQLLAVVRYVVLNPLEAGLCRRPEEYTWSSHMATLDGERGGLVNLDRLFWHLGGFGGDPRTLYAQLTDEAR